MRQIGILHVLIAALAAILASAAAARAEERTARVATVRAVLTLEEMGETPLEIPVGQSRLLTTRTRPGTVIVGDDGIAAATVGVGDSVILTGQSAGTTNLIVLDEQGALLASTLIVVVPVVGPLHSEVIIHSGAAARQRYECRGTRCTPVAAAGNEAPDPAANEAAGP